MKTTGSGWGEFKPSYRLYHPEQFYEGRIVLEHDRQFNAKNVCIVNSGFMGEDKAYLLFVCPRDTTRRRLSDDHPFVLWDFQLASDNSFFYAIDDK